MAHGVDDSEVKMGFRRKSISKEITFNNDTSDSILILNSVEKLARRIQKKLVKSKMYFKTVTVKVRFENFKTYTRSRTITFHNNNLNQLFKTVKQLMDKYLNQKKKIRLVDIKVSNLTEREKQRTLYQYLV
jgi:DNA polymerase IV (DinB-like DNA polymerase)